MIRATATQGLGDWMSTVGNIFSSIGGLLGKKSATLTVPTECLTLDATGQAQCAQMWAQAKAGQIPVASYQAWVQEQQTWATVKKYAPIGLLAFGVLAVVMVLRKPKGGQS